MTGFFYTFAKNFPMRLVCVALGSLLLASCGQDTTARSPAMKIPRDSALFTTIRWIDSTSKNFGTIAEGKKLDVTYRFVNAGDKPLIIEKVQPSCGCTVAEQPEEPVLPGREGVVRASFNSEGRPGLQHKKILVLANTRSDPNNELEFTVTVEKKKW